MKKIWVLVLCMVLLVTACGTKEPNGEVNSDGAVSTSETEKNNKQTDKAEDTGADTSNINSEGLPILKTPENFEIYTLQASTIVAANDKAVVKKSNEETNVVIDFVEVAQSSWKEKTNILFSTGDLPDAFLGGIGVGEKYNMLTPLDEYLTPEIAPNTVAFLNSRPEYWDILRAPDGHIYSLPNGDETYWNIVDAQMWINKQWLENVNMEIPTTADEFYEVLKAFKEMDANGNGDPNDEVPFTFKGTWGWANGLENALTTHGVFESDTHVMTIGDEVKFAAREDGYFEALKFYAKLMAEGLVDVESFTQSGDQYKAKVGKENTTYGVYVRYNPADEEIYAPLIFKNDSGEYMVGINNIERTEGLSITTTCENPEALIRWYDYCNSSFEMMLNWNRGIKDEAWAYADDGTAYQLDDAAIIEKYGAQNKGELRQIQSFAGQAPGFMDLGDTKMWDADVVRPKIVHNMEIVDKGYGVKSLPAGFAEPENTERRALLLADIDNYLNRFIAVSILEGITQEDWDEHLNTLEKLKVDEYTQLCQDYLDSKK